MNSGSNVSVGREEVVVMRGMRTRGGKAKHAFIKCDMAREMDFVGGGVYTPIVTIVGGVFEEDTSNGTRAKFVIACGGLVGIASTSKHPKVVIGWVMMKKDRGGGLVV